MRCWRCARWGRRRCSGSPCLVVSLGLLIVLLLLNIQLDEVCILLDLVLCDTHCQQLLQQGLPRGVCGIDGGAPCAWRAGVAALRRRHHVHARRRHHGLRRWRRVGRMPVAEQASQEAMSVALPVGGRPAGSCGGAERLVLCVLVGVLLAVVDLLLERLGLLLVGEGEGGQAVLELEGVEEDAVLVVGEVVVDLLVPDDATVGRLQHAMSARPLFLSPPLPRPQKQARIRTEMSTSLIQKVLPTRSFASTAAPCRPVYVQLVLSG